MAQTKISGYATPEGTRRYADRHLKENQVVPEHFRKSRQHLTLTSVGMGTYIGNPDPETDRAMTQAAMTSIQSGAINVLDTAINYRFQQSERSLGEALHHLINAGTLQRDEVFICSKNGYLTPDAHVHSNFGDYFRLNYIDAGVVEPHDIVGGMHCMTPRYLAHELNQSLSNLGLETLDLMYLHNAAESQLPDVGTAEFFKRLEAAFTFYESARQENKIRYYGMATWDCFRVQATQTDRFVNLESVVKLAQAAGGETAHGFRFIQLPFNLAMLEALTMPNQTVNGQKMALLDACQALGIEVFTSVPLLQGQLLSQAGLPQFHGLTTPAQAALQFVRSTPGILAPLVGHKQAAHTQENVKIAQVPPLSPNEFTALFSATV